ncbi:MAG: hypothetical protein H6742_17755, partial [Alphaproteobacteria bacterium]|nr:hypothetical protein [Alphaproteobacteria bacterium]
MVLLLPLFWACVQTAAPYDTGAAGGDGGSDDPCAARVTASWPAAGADDVWLQPDFVVQLDSPDPTARLTLVDDGGSEVPLVTAASQDGALWTATLDGQLVEDADYTLKVQTCLDLTDVDFHTLDAPGFPPELVDRGVAYSLDLSYGRLVRPGELERVLAPLLADHQWLVGMALSGDTDSGALALTGAAGNAQTQDTCVPTMALPELALTGSPHVVLGPQA